MAMMLGQLHSYILLQRHELLHVLWRTIWKYNVIGEDVHSLWT